MFGNNESVINAALAELNPEQRAAVDALDGPVLVVAGPGTGKTQLLSLRVVNILRERDVNPADILCLTYTTAGVEAMTRRLAGLIGRRAYSVQIATFHSFAETLYSDHPRYFDRGSQDSAITTLQARALVAELLQQLPISDPLYQPLYNGVSRNLKPTLSFIANFKRSGASPAELRLILEQNQRACAYLEQQLELWQLLESKLNLSQAAKQDLAAQIEAAVEQIALSADRALLEPVLPTPGVYLPFLELFCREFASQPLYDDSTPRGSVARLNELKRRFFAKDAGSNLVLKARAEVAQTESLLGIYEAYQQALRERNQHDFDDMILDAIAAAQQHPELRQQLSDSYKYIMVDEFQDTNGVQMQLLDLVCGFAPATLAAPDFGEVSKDVSGKPDSRCADAGASQPASASSSHQLNIAPDLPPETLTDSTQDNGGEPDFGNAAAAGACPNIMVVGDDDQAIMRFQGASVEYIQQFEGHYGCGAVRRIVLRSNYRSLPELVELTGSVAAQISNRSQASRSEKQLQAVRAAGEPPRLVAKSYPNQALQCFAVAQEIAQLIEAGFIANALDPQTAIAVIAAKHASLEAMLPYLNHFGVPFEYVRKSDVLRVEAMQTLLVCLRCVCYLAENRPRNAEPYLPQILAAPEFGIDARSCLRFALAVRKSQKSWLEALLWVLEPEELGEETLSIALQANSEGRQVTVASELDAAQPSLAEQELLAAANTDIRRLFAYLCDAAQKANSLSLRGALLELAAPILEYYNSRAEAEPYSAMELNYSLGALLSLAAAELDDADSLGSPPRLPQLMELLEQARLYGAKVEIEMPFVQDSAVTLTTAHSSKGLEFDLVYLLDASQNNWHGKESRGAQISSNLLFANSRDEDDDRRLLYVAMTRARDQIRVSAVGGDLVGELLENYELEDVKPGILQAAIQAEVDLYGSYHPSNPELLDLYRPILRRLRVSPSLLNSFVTYKHDQHDHRDFILSQVLRLPGQPVLALEFGNLVHGFLEDYINLFHKEQDPEAGLERLRQRTLSKLWRLDFGEADLRHLEQRLSGIVEKFLPYLNELLSDDTGQAGSRIMSGELLTEHWLNGELDGVPLTGKSDLLQFDRVQKQIIIYDFKTGKAGQQSQGYLRQLLFYKLLIESLPEYDGYTVAAGADLFVEPSRERGWQIAPVQHTDLSTEDLQQLRLLICAVWERLQNGRFDTAGFEDSLELAELLASNTKANGEAKKPTNQQLQGAFERWLVSDYQKSQAMSEVGA